MSFPQLRVALPSATHAGAAPAGAASTGPTTSQLLMSRSPALSSSSPASGGAPPVTVVAPGPRTPTSPCCENGRPVLTDPNTGQTICSCQYPAGLLSAAAVYPRMPASGMTAESMYGPYAAAAAQGLIQLAGNDPTTLYPTLNPPYELKEGPDGLRSLAAPQPLSYYPYEAATLAGYPYSYGGMDLSAAARRKNATRENTNTLKAWLYEHRKNPYPTKGEKIMLAIITKMTLTQVSTWFANARRRLKKENKMTWSPRNRPEDEDDDDDDDILTENATVVNGNENIINDKMNDSVKDLTTFTKMVDIEQGDSDDDEIIDAGTEVYPEETNNHLNAPMSPHSRLCASNRISNHDTDDSVGNSRSSSPDRHSDSYRAPSPIHSPRRTPIVKPSTSSPSQAKDPIKPKIWSVAEMASSTVLRTSESEVRSPSPQKDNDTQKPASHQSHAIPVRPSVTLASPVVGLPPSQGYSPLTGGPHPHHLNGLCPPWFGLSGAYPMPFHSRALTAAHPYLVSAAGPHGPPASVLNQQALRVHHDFLKQASSMHIPVYERSSSEITVRENTQTHDLNETTAFRPVPTRPTMAC